MQLLASVEWHEWTAAPGKGPEEGRSVVTAPGPSVCHLPHSFQQSEQMIRMG